MKILGIETSCDETAAAVVQNGKILSNIIYSQQIHNASGGVVPELASREHELLLNSLVIEALNTASVKKTELDAVAVTQGPGLAGSLLTGVCFAKGMALTLDIPIISINHLEAHIYANFLDTPSLITPFICLLVSGGHTQLWLISAQNKYKLLGETRDDAAGEAFDKGARILGLGYPGGPEIEKCAVGGNSKEVSFPRALMGEDNLEFSFSGLKTSLLYYIKKMDENEKKEKMSDIAASYQSAIIDVLITKLKNASIIYGINTCVISGGVGANRSLRESAKNRLSHAKVYFPSVSLCTDNAAMVAYLGELKLISGEKADIKFPVLPNFPLA
ncbi:MAG: tRNA (adenosine(37)-N6)-threonylcarbamoyltransferase complex transferase subunit TsaD [Candidatus Marinimicrobia bacterium]|nr:tRNA (adenosine(37)-N6)-threonylcarbamoyltransferase complex transferase subunit TsaD [Candidatus Neomarinimicrobiota bacterium]|tara:strand:+ start:14360 stop:15352 length:993 start_codon:yes stop_codon:yes gene_type:complete